MLLFGEFSCVWSVALGLSKFQESLLVISAIKTILESDLRVFKRYIKDEDLKFSLNNKMLVDISSFLDEWKRFETYAKDDERIKETMKITAPAIKRLLRWTGIKGMRNTMLAHGFRDRGNGGKPTCLEARYFDADVPTTYEEDLSYIDLYFRFFERTTRKE